MELTKLSIEELNNGLRSKQFSAKEIIDAHAETIRREKLNAFVTKTLEQAKIQAKIADQNIEKGKMRVLEGVPVGIKDLFCTKGIRTTTCSRILENFIPPYESTVSAKLMHAGAIMMGKTNMDEFAMGSSNKNSCFGPTINPWQIEQGLTPGGSSGGSAAAVAGHLCTGALGSDTGGSIRQPASFCGIVGIKPTYGRCSRHGMVAFASSLDQAGVFARSVKDATYLLQTICGYDAQDSTSLNIETPNFMDSISHKVNKLKIGIPKEYRSQNISTEIKNLWQQSIEWLQEEGAEIIEISLPHTEYALATYYIINPAEVSSNLARYDGLRYGLRIEGDSYQEMYAKTRNAGFGEEAKRRILIGTYVLSASHYGKYYQKAQKVRTLIIQDFTDAFAKVDAILTPTTPSDAFKLTDKIDNISMYGNDFFTVPASLAGLPAISVPAGLSSNNRPLGLQIVGNYFNESIILNIANIIEEKSCFPELS
jgi:aspartyl-tRNA(Asn)/glutamyl-tRNA(Gln) amidotransferase subunit A